MTSKSAIIAALPNSFDWVVAERSVERNDSQVMANGLRDNHAVKGIAMPRFWKGKPSHSFSVFCRNMQHAKVIPGHMSFYELLKWGGQGELALAGFNCHLLDMGSA